MVPMTVSMQCVALCVSIRGLSLHLIVVATPTLAMGNGKDAKGKVATLAKKDMDVKDNVHNIETKAMHATMHAVKKVKKTSGHACAEL